MRTLYNIDIEIMHNHMFRLKMILASAENDLRLQ